MATSADIGREIGEARFVLERSNTMNLAAALFDDDLVYRDRDAAQAAGFDAIPAPLTASALAAHWASDGVEGTALALGIDLARLLHGESSWEYLRPLYVGDALSGHTKVADVSTREGKRGGTMTLVVLETEYVDADGEVVLRKRDTLIEREG